MDFALKITATVMAGREIEVQRTSKGLTVFHLIIYQTAGNFLKLFGHHLQYQIPMLFSYVFNFVCLLWNIRSLKYTELTWTLLSHLLLFQTIIAQPNRKHIPIIRLNEMGGSRKSCTKKKKKKSFCSKRRNEFLIRSFTEGFIYIKFRLIPNNISTSPQ